MTVGAREARSTRAQRGYGFADKEAWRNEVWWHASRFSASADRSAARVFLIESLEGREIEKALRLGFSELHVCNSNPAVVATLKRRYPMIQTYGVDAYRALRRADSLGIAFDIISLDFCSCLSEKVFETLWAAAWASAYPATFIVNVQRGRENRDVTGIIRSESLEAPGGMFIHDAAREGLERDQARPRAVHTALAVALEERWTKLAPGPAWRSAFCWLAATGVYKGKHVTMGWSVVRSDVRAAFGVIKRRGRWARSCAVRRRAE